VTELLALGALAANNANIFHAIRDSDIMGVLCLLVCMILSIISWMVIFYKIAQFHKAMKSSDEFVDRCMSGPGSLDVAYRLTGEYPQSPLAQIMREAYLEMQMENWYADANYGETERLTASRLGLERVIERTISEEIRRLEGYLIFLATTSSVAPFIGLFGTVWGVLGAFQAMSQTGSAALQALAPGMATALTATIAGLLAAIPASAFYNYFTNKLSIMISRMDAFSLELANVMQKTMIKQLVRDR
jgi:biopolymer transport protein TolQ